jgi:glyceraldehyde 3-phosphate dehydrogenase
VVIDCTGVFKTEAALAPYFEAGVKKVVVSAPVKDGDAANIVFGVNDDIYDPARHRYRHGGVLHHQLPRAGG